MPLNSRCSRKWLTPLSSRRLVAGADADPDTGGDRQRARHAFGGHSEAGVELSDPKVGQRNRARSAMATRATVAGAAAVVATRAAVTSVGSTIRGAAAGFAAGAEVAELAGELGVERVVEADGNRTVTGGDRLGSATGGRGAAAADEAERRGRRHRWGTGSTKRRGSG